MYSKIIIGYDGSDSAEDALALGREVGRATELLFGGTVTELLSQAAAEQRA